MAARLVGPFAHVCRVDGGHRVFYEGQSYLVPGAPLPALLQHEGRLIINSQPAEGFLEEEGPIFPLAGVEGRLVPPLIQPSAMDPIRRFLAGLGGPAALACLLLLFQKP